MSLRCVLRAVDGELSDWVDAGATNVFEIGCNHTRPNSTSPWTACANRRGRCAGGWVDKAAGLCGND